MSKELLQEHIDKTALLTDELFYYLFSHFKSMSFKKGQTDISAGDKVDCEYFILSRCLKAFLSIRKSDLDSKTNVEVLCLSNSNNFVLNCNKCFFSLVH